MKTVGIYARVSTVDQTVTQQLEALRNYCNLSMLSPLFLELSIYAENMPQKVYFVNLDGQELYYQLRANAKFHLVKQDKNFSIK